MKILAFGKGGLSGALANSFILRNFHEVIEVSKDECDIRDVHEVQSTMLRHQPDWIVNCAGLSDQVGASLQEVIDVNLTGALTIGQFALATGTPCILVASTAGIVPGNHSWYGAAKAGVITFVRANSGGKIWAISPGRMDTTMRQRDWPEEDPRTRLHPKVVSGVVMDIMDGDYAQGANVIVRKVGLRRVDIYEEPTTVLPSRLS